jgi:ferredoxin
MNVIVNRAMCQGHALCNQAAPDLFTLDDEGYSDVTESEVPAGSEEIARRGALRCPELAITIVE